MALSVTVAEVLPTGTGATFEKTFVAATTITAGKVVYLNASNQWALAQCDGTTIEAGSGVQFGFAMHAALAGQPLCVQTGGVFVVGATAAPTVGVIYCIGATAGDIVAQADLVATNKITILGVGATSSTIDMAIKRYTGYTVPA